MGILNRKAMIALLLPLMFSTAQAAERFPPAYFKVNEQLKNFTINFENGLPSETIASKVKGEFDAMTGLTRDVKGQQSVFWAYFASPADLERFVDAWQNGLKVEGTLQCKLVHIGTGPIVPPAQKFGIVADDCVLKAAKSVN